MNMNKRLKNHLQKKSRSYWFYYHLKHDDDFRKEAAELDTKLLITLDDGTRYQPTGVEDFDYLHDPDKEKKLAFTEEFQIKWQIHWDYYLLNYLIRGNPEDVPPSTGNGIVGLIYKSERNMFEAQISPNSTKLDLDLLWLMLKSEKKRLGMDMSKKPHKNTFTEHSTKVAYDMWRMLRDGATWTEVLKVIDARYPDNAPFANRIGDAQDFLNSHGYNPR
jgi:hypothetical protein